MKVSVWKLVIITSINKHIQKLLQHLDQKALLLVWRSLVKTSLKCYFIKFIGSCWYNVRMLCLFLPSLSLPCHGTVFPGAEGWQYEQIITMNHWLFQSHSIQSTWLQSHVSFVLNYYSFLQTCPVYAHCNTHTHRFVLLYLWGPPVSNPDHHHHNNP